MRWLFDVLDVTLKHPLDLSVERSLISELIGLHVLALDQKFVITKRKEAYSLLVVIFSSVSLPEGSFTMVT